MKSVSEMMRFLNRCFSTDMRSRRYGGRSRDRVAGPELMEPRLLLAADLSDVLYDPLVLSQLGEFISERVFLFSSFIPYFCLLVFRYFGYFSCVIFFLVFFRLANCKQILHSIFTFS